MSDILGPELKNVRETLKRALAEANKLQDDSACAERVRGMLVYTLQRTHAIHGTQDLAKLTNTQKGLERALAEADRLGDHNTSVEAADERLQITRGLLRTARRKCQAVEEMALAQFADNAYPNSE